MNCVGNLKILFPCTVICVLSTAITLPKSLPSFVQTPLRTNRSKSCIEDIFLQYCIHLKLYNY